MSPGASSPLRGSLDASCGVRLTASSISSTRSGRTPIRRWARVRISLPVRPPCCAEASSSTPTSRPGLGRSPKGLLRDYADRGGTVLLSSHLIHEIEAIADDLVVIGNGQIVAQGTKADLLEQSGVLIRAANRLIVACALAEADISTTPVGEDGLLAQGDIEQIGRIVFAAGIPVTELRPADGGGLEAMFLELTAETQRESTTSRQSERAAS
jgi:hypothetical protein